MDNFTTWKTASGGDANSVAAFGGTGGLNAAGMPLAGSPVIAAGTNLASVGTAAVADDRFFLPQLPVNLADDLALFRAKLGEATIGSARCSG
jgi:hypothetical protein